MDKGLTVPTWVLINWPKIPQMPRNLSAQIVCPYPKDFDEKRLYWVSVVRGEYEKLQTSSTTVYRECALEAQLQGFSDY